MLLRGPGLPRAADVVGRLVAVQAQEHAYALWSVAQRMRGSATSRSMAQAFDEGQILRTHVLRPTWHYVAPTDLRWLIRLSGPRVDAHNARRYRELELDPRTLARSNELIAEAVHATPLTRKQLSGILEAHGVSTVGQRMPYMLLHAELCSVICSGPMRGKEHTFAAFDQRVPVVAGPEGDEEALAALLLRYFSTRGPATMSDFMWWSGLSAPDARAGLESVKSQLVSRTMTGRTCWMSADAQPSRPSASPRIDLVQCFDEIIISYRQTRDVLHTPTASFTVPGFVDGFTHVLLLDGRLLGLWRRRQDRTGLRVETRIDRSLEPDEQQALDAAIERYLRFAEP